MKYQLVNVGRAKFCGEIEADDYRQLYKEVRKHLASNMPDIEWDEDRKRAWIHTGFHTVGEIRVVEG